MDPIVLIVIREKHQIRVSISKSIPGLSVNFPDSSLSLNPLETCTVTLEWRPLMAQALRETLQLTDDHRGRYEVVVIFKAVSKSAKSKGSRKSPTKGKKIGIRTSPKHFKNICPNVIKKIISPTFSKNNYDLSSWKDVTTFDSRKKVMNWNCNTNTPPSRMPQAKQTENIRYVPNSRNQILHSIDNLNIYKDVSHKNHQDSFQTIDKFCGKENLSPLYDIKPLKNILKLHNSNDEINFSSLEFTPLKDRNNYITGNELDAENNLRRETYVVNNMGPQTPHRFDLEPPAIMVISDDAITIPSISHIDISFHPHRCSTERKEIDVNNKPFCTRLCKGLFIDEGDVVHTPDFKLNNNTYSCLSSDTYTKGDSPIIPLDPRNPYNLQSSPYNQEHGIDLYKRNFSPPCQPKSYVDVNSINSNLEKKLERELKNNNLENHAQSNIYHNTYNLGQYSAKRLPKELKFGETVKNTIEADLWPKKTSPPRSMSPLYSIPEETAPSVNGSLFNETDKKALTFTIENSVSVIPKKNKDFCAWSDSLRSEKDYTMGPPASKIISKVKTKGSQKKTLNSQSRNGVVSEATVNNSYIAASTLDPFLSRLYVYDEKEVSKYELEFIRWLNYLLTPPADLDSNADETNVNLGQVWIDTRNKDIPAAPTREQVSLLYHNSHRLESLRKSARSLIMSDSFCQVFTKLQAQIDKKIISIRSDKNLHLDINLQHTILKLLLSYNPLWLRIGLEAVFGSVVQMTSNNDIRSLSLFIINNLFKNLNFKTKNSKTPNVLTPAYAEHMKKFSLKKFFMLVYFLDQSKHKRLILHDPCLFCRNAEIKESREILITFTRILIAGIGDITKHLKPLGYIVSHKQSYLDEYKYAVHNLAIDLIDGIRLTKLMEIILVRDGLTKSLRTPPISKLQKIHNVQVALNALKESNYTIAGEITAKDIVEGHREKTLSLIWQLIHVLRAPLFDKAAITIQLWWKKKYFKFSLEKMIQNKKYMRINYAASRIQEWWRQILLKRFIRKEQQKILSSTIVIQKYWRRWICLKHFKKCKASAITIQRMFKSVQEIRKAKIIKNQLACEKQSVIKLQKWYRCCLMAKKIMIIRNIYIEYCIKIKKLNSAATVIKRYIKSYLIRRKFTSLVMLLIDTETERKHFIKRNDCAAKIQSLVRMTIEHRKYLLIRKSILCIQRKYQAYCKMQHQRNNYLTIRKSVITIQLKFKSYLKMKKDQAIYQKLRQTCILVQRNFRARKLMHINRHYYLILRNTCIFIQRKVRAKQLMKKQRSIFLQLKGACLVIQKKYRSKLLIRSYVNEYQQLRQATTFVQRRYRLMKLTQETRWTFLKMRSTVVYLQQKYRSFKIMTAQRNHYCQIKTACIYVQRWYRATKLAKLDRANYKLTLHAINVIQKWYRAIKLMQKEEKEYKELRHSSVILQRKFRALVAMKETRYNYLKTKSTCLFIQQRYRNLKFGARQRQEYLKIRESAIYIQRWFRSKLRLRKELRQYTILRLTTINLQRRYRAKLSMLFYYNQYQIIRKSCTTIQTWYRKTKEMKILSVDYKKKKNACIKIQRWYKSQKLSKMQRNEFLLLKKCVTLIQRRFCGWLLMKNIHADYMKQKKACITIQRKFRSFQLMVTQREQYKILRISVVKIQKLFRSNRQLRKEYNEYKNLRTNVIYLQRKFRANKAMADQRNRYLQIKKSTVLIQEWYSGAKLTILIQKDFKLKKQACIKIQNWYRLCRKMHYERSKYIKFRDNLILIQRKYKLWHHMKMIQNDFNRLKKACLVIQSHYRCRKLSIKCRQDFLMLRSSVTVIQIWFRSTRLSKIERRNYLLLRSQTVILQRRFKAKLQMIACRKSYESIRKAAIKIQRWYRNAKITQIYQRKYLEKLQAILKIQSYFKMCIQRILYKRKKEAIIKIQRYYRAHKKGSDVRNKLHQIVQSIKDMRLARQKEIKRTQAATIIQAYWRGHCVRAANQHWMQLVELRQRWKDGALNSSQQKLAERSQEALDLLRNFRDMAGIIEAFQTLDLMTSVSPTTYLLENKALWISSTVILYMAYSNRSVPTLETLRLGASIINNLARYKPTALIIYQEDQLPMILTIMMRWCDNDSHLFRSLCTYLWLFGKYDSINKGMSKILQSGTCHKMLLRIRNAVMRKQRMENNVMKSKDTKGHNQSCHNTTFNASLNSSCASGNWSSTPCKQNKNKNLALPMLEPDYGIPRQGQLRFFNNDIHAINSVFSKFEIPS